MRHLRTCQELIELGMTLARDAAERARQDMATPPPEHPMPCSAASALQQANARAIQRTPSYGIVFAHLSRSVRQSIALQAHINAQSNAQTNAYPTDPPAPRAAQASPRPSPAPHQATPPDAIPRIRLDAAERPDWSFAADPDDDTEVEDRLASIRKELDATITAAAPHTENPPKPPAPPKPARRPPTRSRHPANAPPNRFHPARGSG